MASQWEHIKWIPGTRLMVDGFRYQNPGCKSYLLTHFHSDHTTGLTRAFSAGLIFCTPITAKLLKRDMGMPSERICELPMDVPTVIEGTTVTPICANHCPGACMFLFRVRGQGTQRPQTILHTGDMRWHDAMAEHPALKGLTIDYLFMDTTYAKPTHTHPPQEQCIARMADVMKLELEENPKTLFVCGSYHIGKERAYLGVAKLLGWKVWCEPHKRRVLNMLNLSPDLMACLASKPDDAQIHVEFLGGLQPEKLQKRLDRGFWTHGVGFRPTGWTFRKSGKLDKWEVDNVKIYGIPYSEHSSWTELRSCVALLRPRKLVPTVNASNAAAARKIVNRFADLMDLSEDRSRLDFFLQRRQLEASGLGPQKRRKLCHGALEDLTSAVKPEIELRDNKQAAATLKGAEDLEGCCGADEADSIEDSDCESEYSQERKNQHLCMGVPNFPKDCISLQGSGPLAEEFPGQAKMEPCGALLEGSCFQAECVVSSQEHSALKPGLEEQPFVSEALRTPAHVGSCGLQQGGPEKADSCSSSIELLDVSHIDVSEQLKILESIDTHRRFQKLGVEHGLLRRKQATLAAFFGR